jgi:hypothetical protein
MVRERRRRAARHERAQFAVHEPHIVLALIRTNRQRDFQADGLAAEGGGNLFALWRVLNLIAR